MVCRTDIFLFWPSPAERGIGGEDVGQLVRDERVRIEECWAGQNNICLTLLFIHALVSRSLQKLVLLPASTSLISF